MSVSVFQLGARMKYAVPRCLHRDGLLEKLYTDICVDLPPFSWGRSLMSKLPWSAFQKFVGREVGLPKNSITHFPFMGLRYFMSKKSILNEESECKTFMWADHHFGSLVNSALQKDPAEVLYLYNTAALTVAKENRHRKILLEQCSLPYSEYRDRIQKEMKLFSDWTTAYAQEIDLPEPVQQYMDREELEWGLADAIICPSRNVADSLMGRGVSPDKITCIPYGFTFGVGKQPRKLAERKKLQVGTIGYLALRKGIHYFYKVATACDFADFVAIGGDGFDLPEEKKKMLSKVMTLTGHLDRFRLLEMLQQIDVLLFLSIGEGSATVVYEALSLGIPVITTAASGSIVEDGVSGFIVDPTDTDRILLLLEQMRDPEYYLNLSMNSLDRSKYGSSEAYGLRLVNFIHQSEAL